MKYCISIFFLFLAITSEAQVITYDDFREVIPFLQKEDYKGAFEKTKVLLTSTKNDSSDLRGIVTYMNIYSAAGMVTKDQMTHGEFLKVATVFIGQRVVMSGHPYVDSASDAFNSIQFVTEAGILQGEVATANKAGTNILCFEYFKFADKVNPGDFVGKTVRCGGILESVEVNPYNSKLWISRLHVTNAFAREMTPR
jgi:hypothetical protein